MTLKLRADSATAKPEESLYEIRGENTYKKP